MRQNQASLTAIGIAMLRALESERPESERISCDPYARLFVPGWLYWTGRFFTAIGYAEWRGPGVQGFLVARERYIDEHLVAALGEGVRQLVILGAGYDARAYRFQDLLRGVRVFELDHPATQAGKVTRLKAILGQLPADVAYVSIDFDTQSLEERLPECGYDPSLKTMFIWQGVTYYLTEAAVDSTLAFVRRRSGSGSSIIFDYIDRSILEKAGRHGEVANLRRYRRLTGEGLIFGIPDGTVDTFLRQRGLVRVKSVHSDDLHRLYFTGERQARAVASGYGIVSATVPKGCRGGAQRGCPMKLTNTSNRIVYRLWAPVYDATVNHIFRPGRRRAMQLLGPQPGERILVVGAGTGTHLSLLPGGVVSVGIGLSPDLLAKAGYEHSISSSVSPYEDLSQRRRPPDPRFQLSIRLAGLPCLAPRATNRLCKMSPRFCGRMRRRSAMTLSTTTTPRSRLSFFRLKTAWIS